MLHLHKLGLALVATSALAAALPACAASSEMEDTASGTDDLVTSRCPTAVTIEHDKPFVFNEAPTKQADGTPLAKAEQERVKAAMNTARRLGPETITAGNLVKRDGTCSYSSGGTRIVLRTKNGKDRLDITMGSLRALAFPSSFDKNGLRFGADTLLNLVTNVGSGSASSDEQLDVRIGKVRVTAPGAKPTGPTLRVPVLDESGELVSKSDPSFPKTIVLDGRTGPDTYSALTDRISKKDIEPMRFAGPNDYTTKDPSTSICFNGDENAVCDLLGAFVDNLLSDMFGIAGGEDDSSGCVVTKNNVSVTYFMSESDSTASADIPRCK